MVRVERIETLMLSLMACTRYAEYPVGAAGGGVATPGDEGMSSRPGVVGREGFDW